MTDPLDEQTIPVRRTQPAGQAQDDDSTIIARRESRRRAGREQPTASTASDRLPPQVATHGRAAFAPGAAPPAVYGARSPQPVIALRTAPAQRAAQSPVDGAAATAAHRRRARRTAAIVLICAAAVALTTAGAILFLALPT